MTEINQPAVGQWKQGTFDCCSDCGDCLFAYFLPPCYNYTVAKAAEQSTGCAILTFCFGITLCCIRGTVREKYGIEGSPVNDFLCTVCCPLCTAVQIKHECTH
ncbi:placenta-specific protein 8 -like [Brachionus plicatilis]|uniref:Placenta-specific protein 8-like n=1 Tax=Brachionus plicatilis TaxID=10195 RepID=A0A3M7Q716_BRAPC|nr:placenta-specific protein 8 -like [Brachionus plicatilis]